MMRPVIGLFRTERNASLARPRALVSRALVATGLLGSVLACGGDATGPTPLTPAQAYWALTLNQHAVTFALTGSPDTLRLVATPTNVLGQTLPNAGTVHFRTADSSVTVDSTGLVKARYVTSGKVTVIASLTNAMQHVTLADTCYIQVRSTTPSLPLATFTIQPATGYGTTMPVDSSYVMTVRARNANGGNVTSFPYYSSGNPNIAKIDPLTGRITGIRRADVQLYAQTWAYGVAMRDSLTLTVGLVAGEQIRVLPVTPTGSTQPILTFWPQIVRIAAGGKVSWSNSSYTDSMDVVFDDPTNVDSVAFNQFFAMGTGEGNIAPWVADSLGTSDIGARFCLKLGGTPPNCAGYALELRTMFRQRVFPVPGTYHYHSEIWGTSGTIIVE